MRIPAPAKINLHLRVGPPRDDGFHPLVSWIVTVGLFDTLTLVRQTKVDPTRAEAMPLHAGVQRILTLSCNDPVLPVGGQNLVVRAATALADAVREDRLGLSGKGETEIPLAPVSAFLNKRIPSGAGLGGGSSDAAAALIGLSRLWKLDVPLARLRDIAAELGSDVPFFLGPPASICTGRGEVVHPAPCPDICRWAVLVLPQFELATPAVYRRLDQLQLARPLTGEPDWAAWARLPAAELMPRLVNDLEAPAFDLCPALDALRRSLEASSGRVFRMSGSGSSLFALYVEQSCEIGGDIAADQNQPAEAATQYRAAIAALSPFVDASYSDPHLASEVAEAKWKLSKVVAGAERGRLVREAIAVLEALQRTKRLAPDRAKLLATIRASTR